jgi:HEAT repeat protein
VALLAAAAVRMSASRREAVPIAPATPVEVQNLEREQPLPPVPPPQAASPSDPAEPAPFRVNFPEGSATIDEIREWLQSDDYKKQWLGVRALESLKDERLKRELLLVMLRCKEATFRWSALYRLKRQDEASTMEILRTFVRKDPSAEVRMHAAGLLGEPGGEANIELLLQVFREDEQKVQVRAAASLNFLGQPGPMTELLPKLAAAQESPDAALRKEAAASIEQFRSPATLPHLTRALRDTSGDVRLVAARSLWELGGIGHREVIPLLEGVAQDPVEEVREAVKVYLQKLKNPTEKP